jgi:hypothetical protein
MNNLPLDSVIIRNIHSDQKIQTASDGLFDIIVKNGELLEFEKRTYQKLRVRIVNEKEPSYYILNMQLKRPLVDVKGYLLAYQLDSLKFDKIYGILVNGERIEDVNMKSLPLAALSKQNREKWAFQRMYDKWQREKYIDFVFNEKLVEKITYLKGNDLRRFMSLYRPNASFLRGATEYEYLEYIKKSFLQFQKQGKY